MKIEDFPLEEMKESILQCFRTLDSAKIPVNQLELKKILIAELHIVCMSLGNAKGLLDELFEQMEKKVMKIYKLEMSFIFTSYSYFFDSLESAINYLLPNVMDIKSAFITEYNPLENGRFEHFCWHIEIYRKQNKFNVFEDESEAILKKLNVEYIRKPEQRRGTDEPQDQTPA